MSNESYTAYSLTPYYRIRDYGSNPATTCQKIMYHTFGAGIYVSIHLVSALFIYSSTQNATFAYTVGVLYLFFSSILHYNECKGVYVIDLEIGAREDDAYPNTNTKTKVAPKDSETSYQTEPGVTESHLD